GVAQTPGVACNHGGLSFEIHRGFPSIKSSRYIRQIRGQTTIFASACGENRKTWSVPGSQRRRPAIPTGPGQLPEGWKLFKTLEDDVQDPEPTGLTGCTGWCNGALSCQSRSSC